MKLLRFNMKIGFIGNFSRGYVGETSDESHLSLEMENLGHQVYRIPRDEWRENVRQGLKYTNVPEDVTFDCVVIAKWPHFYDGSFTEKAREKYKCPVFLWVWDMMMDNDQKLPEWHVKMIQGADMYLGNDVRTPAYMNDPILSKKAYYFPFDVSSKEFDRVEAEKKYDVVFFGSHMAKGDRVEWIRKINQIYTVKIFSWNYQEWQKEGFDAEPAIYGEEFARKVAESKIVLGFNVNDHTWGYWSNRVGKVLTVGGFLLYRYVPGMELFLRDGAEYFSSPDEAIQKIAYYLEHERERQAIANRGYEIGRDRFTSKARMKELMILIERFRKGAFLR